MTGNKNYLDALRGVKKRVPEQRERLLGRARNSVEILVGSALRNGHAIPAKKFGTAFRIYSRVAAQQLRMPKPYAEAMVGYEMQELMHRMVMEQMLRDDPDRVLSKVEPIDQVGLYPINGALGLRAYAAVIREKPSLRPAYRRA